MRSSRWLHLVAITAVPLVLLATRVAAAGDRTEGGAPSPRARALDLFEQSAKAYREGRFQDAIGLLMEARRVKREPVLLYNIGRAYEALGNATQAADMYAAYLEEDPRAPDRRAIELRIATLRAQADQLEKARTMPPPVEAKPLPPEPRPLPPPSPAALPRATPWVVIGVGVVGVGVGVSLGLVASARHRAAVDEPAQLPAQHKQDQAEAFATGATVAFVAGAAVTAVGAFWLTVRVLRPAGVNVVAGPTSLGIRGRF